MRYMVIMKANADTEAEVMPGERELAEMGEFNESLVKAGVLLAGEGLRASVHGARVRFTADAKPTVSDGPFGDPAELVAGFWLWQVRSRGEALEWVKRIPNSEGRTFEVELRKVFEMEDFGEAMTPDLRAREERLRGEVDARH